MNNTKETIEGEDGREDKYEREAGGRGRPFVFALIALDWCYFNWS